jgi:hypothetical protein
MKGSKRTGWVIVTGFEDRGKGYKGGKEVFRVKIVYIGDRLLK